MASLKEIAAACGVSIATVSKALNDHKDIGAETKERVRAKARELGYFPNAQARALKTNKTHNIGVLMVDKADNGLTHDYFNHVLDSFKRTVEEVGYDITFINGSKKGRNGLSLLEHCCYRNFDGVLIACVNFNDAEVSELIQSDIPVVTIDHVFHDRIAVLSDNTKGMTALTEYIIAMGHRRIAYIHGEDVSVTKTRVSAFLRTCDAHGIEIPDEYLVPAHYRSIETAKKATEQVLALKDRPTCILYPDDYAGFGGIAAIAEAGLKIPEDISIAAYDGIQIGRHMIPQFTTVRQNTEEIGRLAAVGLLELITKPKTTLIEHRLVSGTLLEGATVGRVPQE